MLYNENKALQQILENSQDVMFIAHEREFLDANKAALKMFGVTSKDAFLKMHPAAFSPEFQEDGQSSYLKANEMISIALKDGFHRFKWLHKTLKDEPINTEVTLVIFKDEGKDLSFVQIRRLSSLKV